MQKKVAILLLIILLTASLVMTACNGNSSEVLPTQAADVPINGVVTGGDESLKENVNLQNINVEQQGENTVITLYFLSGSRVAGVNESKLSSAPQYTAQLLSAPYRLEVDLEISFWDYAQNSETYNNSVLDGLFNTIYSDGNRMSVFFQLNENVEASVREDGDKLIFTLAPKPLSSQKAYYVGLNAYEAYEQNLISNETGLTPTMCEGLKDIMLISKPMRDQASANKLVEEINLKIASAVPAKKAYAFEMETDMLPQYNKNADTESIKEEPVILKDGIPTPLPVLVENGRYLCMTPEGNTIYARSYVPNSGEDTEQVLKEKLWMLESSGKKTQLELQDFYSVEKAAMSVDGRYLAILDSGIENKVLYVYDAQEKALHNLGEEGLGNITTSFVWDAEQPVIYAMSGSASSDGTDALQLIKYDFSKSAGSRINGIGGDMPGADSKIALVNGKIYYADKAETEEGMGAVYSVDIGTEERVKVASGVDFAVSKDGNNIAAIVPVKPDSGTEQDSETMTFNVVMTNLATGTQTDVLTGASGDGIGLAFDADSDTLYISTSSYEGVTADYPFAILKYTISTPQLSLLEYSKTDKIMPGVNAGELYIINYYSQNDDSFYVTYIQTEQ